MVLSPLECCEFSRSLLKRLKPCHINAPPHSRYPIDHHITQSIGSLRVETL